MKDSKRELRLLRVAERIVIAVGLIWLGSIVMAILVDGLGIIDIQPLPWALPILIAVSVPVGWKYGPRWVGLSEDLS